MLTFLYINVVKVLVWFYIIEIKSYLQVHLGAGNKNEVKILNCDS